MQEQVCKNCANHFTGKFCNNCGEKVYNEKDKKVAHLFEEAFHFITHFEGTFFTSLKTIFRTPGKLSVDFCNGIRKKYFKPLSFFLMLVILYLLFPLFEGLNMKMYYHTVHDVYGSFAAKKVAAVMQEKHMTWDQLSEAFHNKGEKVSKFLLFSVIPVLAFVSWLLGYKKIRYYYDHFIFSTEASSFFLLWGFLLFPVIVYLIRSITGVMFLGGDAYLGIFIIGALAIFILIAARRFFQFKWWYSVLYTLIYLAALAGYINTVYKFILFNLAINQI